MSLINKFFRVWKEYGFLAAMKKALVVAGNREGRKQRKKDIKIVRASCGDVLFINGCTVENPTRYRVLHQMEELRNQGLHCDKIFFKDLKIDMEKKYRLFVFYRCEATENVKEFIALARRNGKKTIFDIDDLVIDTKYTDELEFVQDLSPLERAVFDAGVMKNGETLAQCDIAVASTEALAEELGKQVPKTFVNRNTASTEMVELSELAYEQGRKERERKERIRLGYFSGSLTHNRDFEMIKPVVQRILEKYQQVDLMIVGELEDSDVLNSFGDRVIRCDKVPWRKLPFLLVQADINLAPLEDTLFNCCKSEIKWIEAGLVRVPTIASDVGAYTRMVQNHITGILCSNIEDAWYEGLCELIESEEMRRDIGESVYQDVMTRCTTRTASKVYSDWIRKYLK